MVCNRTCLNILCMILVVVVLSVKIDIASWGFQRLVKMEWIIAPFGAFLNIALSYVLLVDTYTFFST